MNNKKVKIGLICVGLEGERLELAQEFMQQAQQSLARKGLTVVNPDAVYTLTGAQVQDQAIACRQAGAVAIVYLIGTWILANHIIDAVQRVDLPVGVWGIPEESSFSSVGANVVHGAMEEMGIQHRLFYGDAQDQQTVEEISIFARAAMLRASLKGARMGLIGGRGINAYPTAADPNQIKALFGTEIEHIDQLLLLEKARNAPMDRVTEIARELKAAYTVEVADNTFERTVRVYIALSEIVEEYALDFCSVKCLDEFINQYTSCCVAVALSNDRGIVTGCQCNINASISMYLLSQLSDEPVFFGDVNVVHIKDCVARLINCGSIPTRLAKQASDVRFETQYEYMGAGSGACTMFCCKPGPVTFGTLGRRNGQYVMNIAEGQAFEQPIEELRWVRNWAQGFVRLKGDPMNFYNNILSNHSVLCYGSCEKELIEFCRLTGVTPNLNFL